MNRYMARLIDDVRADDLPDPLRERIGLAAVRDNLRRPAGEVPPPQVRRALGDRAHDGLAAPMGTAAAASPPGAAARPRGGRR